MITTLALIMTLSAPARADAEIEFIEQPAEAPIGGFGVDVVGGEVLSPSAFPWVVSGHCAGTLVAPLWVVSAAHCGDRTGATYTVGASEIRTVVDHFTPFNGAYKQGLTPDIALWKLDRPSMLTPLAFTSDRSLTDPGRLVQGIGYGDTEAGGGGADGQLRTTGWVETFAGLFSWDFKFGLTNATTCFGDSGGPIVAEGDPPGSDLILVGVVSYSTRDGQGTPCTNQAGGARLADHAEWIHTMIGTESLPGDESPNPVTASPTVMHATSCLGGAGRVDTNLVNDHDSSARYFVEFEGLSRRGGGVVAPSDWWRLAVTGRSDGHYEVDVTRDGEVISSTTVEIRCNEDPPALGGDDIRVVNSCRATNGYVLFQFLNLSEARRSWVIEFQGVPNRSTTAAPHGAAVRAVTGRPDGAYRYSIRIGNQRVASGTITVSC